MPGENETVSVVNVLTTAGKNLLAAAVTGAGIILTRAELGTGFAEEGADLESRTALIAKAYDAEISRKKLDGNTAIVSVSFVNTDVEDAFRVGEIGIFAKTANTSEILFSYLTFGSVDANGDLILSENTATVQRVYDIPFVFSGSPEIAVTISPSGLVTAGDVITSALPASSDNEGKLVALDANGKLPVDITGDANTLDGHDSTYFATADHTHADATTSVPGFMSVADKTWTETAKGYLDQSVKQNASPKFTGLDLQGGYIDNALFR